MFQPSRETLIKEIKYTNYKHSRCVQISAVFKNELTNALLNILICVFMNKHEEVIIKYIKMRTYTMYYF